ncbi:MAG: tetratricopeptide repeat protein [Thermodesulfobacteriota bacterium]|nr:tetratricopeptide repeat protein [Thermodesulfobacteriota bacterium]
MQPVDDHQNQFDKNENSIFGSIFLSMIVIGVLVFSTIVAVKYINPRSYLKQVFGSKGYEVTKPLKDLPILTEAKETIDIAQIINLRDMLQNHEFERLNAVLKKYQHCFTEDQTDEYKVYDAYRTFYLTDSLYEALFVKWINNSPDKYQPYLALANYYCAKGWESRGYKFKKETSKEQFEGMRFYFSKAEENLKIALKINPDLMVGYNLLINIYNATGNDAAEDETIENATALFPHSFLVRYVGAWAKQPRWGGSYKDMEDIAKQAEKYSAINPELTALYGLIYYDRSRMNRRNKRYKRAIDLLTKALTFGDQWSIYYERVKIYHFDLKEYDSALEDINRCIELRPVIDKIYRMRSRIYFAKGNYSDSLEDLRTAELLRPGDPSTIKWKEWASKKLLNKGYRLIKTDNDAAFENYNLSIDFDNDNFESYYWRGVAFFQLEDFQSALSDFNRVIEINPHHFESYRMVDYILAKEKQWSRIIEYWNRFLELEPDHATAYLERAGTYYHNKDFERALHDLEKSCGLGNKEACRRYESLKARL